MSRKKLKALTFLDYGLNLLVSAIGLLSLTWLFRFSIGAYLYSTLFSLSLFMFMYSRGSLAAKIDMRSKEENLKKGEELFNLAEEYNKVVLYEAAIAGGIPIIMPIKTILCANKITKIAYKNDFF